MSPCGQWDKVPDETGGHRPGQGGLSYHAACVLEGTELKVKCVMECRQPEKREFHLSKMHKWERGKGSNYTVQKSSNTLMR